MKIKKAAKSPLTFGLFALFVFGFLFVINTNDKNMFG